MQARAPPKPGFPEGTAYHPLVPRKLSKPRPKQGARLAALRRAAGLTQGELARAVGETQQNIAFWEQASKPPRSDVLPKLARVLGVRLENLLSDEPVVVERRRSGPVGRLQKVLEEAQTLPRRQQDLVVQFVETLLSQHKKAS
jgi:transcriptional regulator with XRE-family HTH domain